MQLLGQNVLPMYVVVENTLISGGGTYKMHMYVIHVHSAVSCMCMQCVLTAFTVFAKRCIYAPIRMNTQLRKLFHTHVYIYHTYTSWYTYIHCDWEKGDGANTSVAYDSGGRGRNASFVRGSSGSHAPSRYSYLLKVYFKTQMTITIRFRCHKHKVAPWRYSLNCTKFK